MEAPVMMDDVVVHANKAAPTMTTVAINQKRSYKRGDLSWG
jgi:hypothetical protein